jgi:hypothetical protein
MPDMPDDAFFDFFTNNQEYRIERSGKGQAALLAWAGAGGRGIDFDSIQARCSFCPMAPCVRRTKSDRHEVHSGAEARGSAERSPRRHTQLSQLLQADAVRPRAGAPRNSQNADSVRKERLLSGHEIDSYLKEQNTILIALQRDTGHCYAGRAKGIFFDTQQLRPTDNCPLSRKLLDLGLGEPYP